MTQDISSSGSYPLYNTLLKLFSFIYNVLGIVCSAFKRVDVVSDLLKGGLRTQHSSLGRTTWPWTKLLIESTPPLRRPEVSSNVYMSPRDIEVY